ncbi:MAG: TIGR03905 family TSCPD domain-containing protein [Erysipelotrichaceae bacterium]|nr:TIGR03905 family TSCPD domain-containing protein [Erysipelotrichaceae bacterium]
MKEFEYKPIGVCSSKIKLLIEGDILKDLEIIGGCPGNLQGIKALVKGMKLTDIKDKLKGIKCGFKNTSCPDQIANAIDRYLGCEK